MEAQSAESADVRADDERVLVLHEALEDGRGFEIDVSTETVDEVYANWRPAFTALNSLVAEVSELRAALEVYADARHWAIGRDDLRYRAVMWVGPGAEKRGLPDAMETARVALSSTTGSGAQAAPPEKP